MFSRTFLRRRHYLSVSFSAMKQLFKSESLACNKATVVRPVATTVCKFQELEPESEDPPSEQKYTTHPSREGCKGYKPRNIDVHDSIRYMESEAYHDVYKDFPVWKPYRRNRKGTNNRPRKTCIRQGVISTSSPCPICRDDYLVLDYRNVKLLKQFVSETNVEPLSIDMTGLCVTQMKRLVLELAKAQDYGLMEKQFPLRQYDYNYYRSLVKNNSNDKTDMPDSEEEHKNHSTS